MRIALIGLALGAFASLGFAQPEGYTSSEGKFSAAFPGAPKVTTTTTKTAVGDLPVTIATYAKDKDGGVFMVSFTDFPESATNPKNHATLLNGIRDGVKSKDGKLVGDEKELKFGPDKLPGREFTVDKEKTKQRIRFRVVIKNSRVYQVAVIGTQGFADGKDASAFLESFELTK